VARAGRRPIAIDPSGGILENPRMEIFGKFQNGVVVFEGGCPFPEGAVVNVRLPAAPATTQVQPAQPVQLPLVPSEKPGTVDLTNDKIAERLGWDDIFATKLEIRPGDPDSEPEITDITGDDLLF